MKIYISGGCKNGKSYFAQRLAKMQQTGDLYYIATMKSTGYEDDDRIKRHIEERLGWGFETVEQPHNIDEILVNCNKQGSFLLDSVTALLANEMFKDREINDNAAEKISDELLKILDKTENIVIVSDYIFSDAVFYDEITEKYRKNLAQIDCLMAKKCDVVLEVVYTNVVVHKGIGLMERINEKIF